MQESSNAMAVMDYGALTETQQDTIYTPQQEWSDDFALKVAVEDFNRAANYRNQNHDWRWINADQLYLGYVSQKYWEGTKIPRANISVFTAYEQIEAMIPRIVQAIFGDNPWFEALAMGNTPQEAARVAKETILAQMDQARVRKILEIAIRSGLIYGNGIVEASWLYSKQTVKKFLPVFIPIRQFAYHPTTGQPMAVPTGQYKRVIKETEEEEYINRPTLANIPLKDFYIDPNCPTSDPNDARYTVARSYPAADYLRSLRDLDNFTIPSDADLVELARNKPLARGDNTKAAEEAARMGMWSPNIDQSMDPGAARLELLRYTTDRRVVWVLNQKVIIRNEPNCYGRKLQYNFSYTDLVDRFYGLAMTDVTEGEQRLQEGVTNARLDELALNIHPSTVVKRGNNTSIYKLRMRPGGVDYSDDPKNDMVRQYTNNVTQQAFQEVAASDNRVQKITGQADVIAGGQNPVARSATGAGLQGQATFSRSQYQIEKIEYNMLEPLLDDFHMLNEYHLDPDQRILAVSGEEIDPILIFGAKVRFTMRAGSRMASKQGLMQAFPFVMQYLANPQFDQQLAQKGKTVDWEELGQILSDATGYRFNGGLIRDLTPQEKQALAQAAQNPQSHDLQLQRERLAAIGDQQMKAKEMDLVDTAIQSRAALEIAGIKEKSKDKKSAD